MNSEYNHADIEKKWQDKWEQEGIYNTPDKVKGKENFYTLTEFTYPSGDLHVGHWYAFSAPDIFARYKRMQGFNVLYPTGFDSFGLPAENAAIKRGLDPKKWTYENMDKMRTQLRTMGASFDWSREVVTSDPEYYKWTQWIFIKLFEKGLAYKKKAVVNWDPIDKTVLANEQVLSDGTAERSGAVVEKREIDQWSLKITEYADKLLEGLDALDWPEQIKEMQRNWIGKSEGAELKFEVKSEKLKEDRFASVFTTRPDTLFGVTYLVLAPEHQLVNELKDHITNWSEVEKYVAVSAGRSELERQSEQKEKTGVRLEGVTAMNPANGEEIPVFIADYVISGYGTGAVMAVPAHDQRDFEFATKFDLPIKQVVTADSADVAKCAYTGEGTLNNSGEFDGLTSEEAKEKITEKVGGTMKSTYRLRDWSIGRQRYWGTPIPIVFDPAGKAHAVPEEHLPWTLPEDVNFKPTGESPLAKSDALKKRTEEIFGKGWTPEVETMDTFVDSSWYFLRYLDYSNEKDLASKEAQKNWMPIDQYFGGSEHTTLHLLYSRFFQKALFDLGVVTEDEPFKRRLNRGLIMGPDGQKMSKSKGNVINPDEVVERVGADTVRAYLAFIGPYNEPGNYPWDPNGVVGIRRFLERVVGLKEKISSGENTDVEKLLHKTIKKVTEDIEQFKFNTAISAMMILVNTAEEAGITKVQYKQLLQLLAPTTPHITEELWESIGEKESIHLSRWPEYHADKIVDETAQLAIQIDGKVRATIEVPTDASEKVIEDTISGNSELGKWLGKKYEIKKIVPNRLVSIVSG